MQSRIFLFFVSSAVIYLSEYVTTQGIIHIIPPEVAFECGVRSTRLATRVTGLTSSISIKNSWPWMALLGSVQTSFQGGRVKTETIWFCGGVLINEKWVLSAAHCVDSVPTFFVRLGEHDHTDDNDGTQHVDYNVENYVNHLKYKPGFKYYDLAVIKLARDVKFQDHIRPICMPWHIGVNDLLGKDVYVSGWGTTHFGGDASPILREVRVKVQNVEACEESYSTANPIFFWREFPQGIKSNQILCAGDSETGGDSCQGDSGGPLSMLDSDGSYVAVGIVSGGIGCGDPNLPGLYIPVMEELLWIRTTCFDIPCFVDTDCDDGEICFATKCIDPCHKRCGTGAVCSIFEGKGACKCPQGYDGNPFSSCTIGISVATTDPCQPNPCGANAMCTSYIARSGDKVAGCACHPTYEGNPYVSCEKVPSFSVITTPTSTKLTALTSSIKVGTTPTTTPSLPVYAFTHRGFSWTGRRQYNSDLCLSLGCGPNTLCSLDSRGQSHCECFIGFVNSTIPLIGCVWKSGAICKSNLNCPGHQRCSYGMCEDTCSLVLEQGEDKCRTRQCVAEDHKYSCGKCKPGYIEKQVTHSCREQWKYDTSMSARDWVLLYGYMSGRGDVHRQNYEINIDDIG